MVREGGSMKKVEGRVLGQDWTAILKKAGIPESPGYKESIAKLYPKVGTNDARKH